jgi:molybdopterin converting factor subunit 1
MRVHVLYFGVLKDAVGLTYEEVDLAEGASVADLLRNSRARASNHPMDERVWQGLAVAVNREYATPGHVLCAGDEVALLPPVSGGGL